MFVIRATNRIISISNRTVSVRNAVVTKNGLILPYPEKSRFGLSKMTLSVGSGLMIGALFSKLMATFLEENELFIPSEDDDDDDD